ncbi:hypothetical protein BDV12DRAFT_197470 [Aspergillus spectabilis]
MTLKSASEAYDYYFALSREDPAAHQIKEAFTQALRVVKETALNNEVNITSPVILYPDFFNWQVQRLIYEAAYDAGLDILSWQIITQGQLLERYGDAALFNQSLTAFPGGTPQANQSSLLILIQDIGTFDLMSSGKHELLSFPVEYMGCHRILNNLWVRVTASKEFLREELGWDASPNHMSGEIMRVRGYSRRRRSLMRHWGWETRDLKSGRWIWMGGTRGYTYELASAKSIEGVVIIRSYCDVSLLARAAKRSIGEHVKILGAPSGADTTYLARLGASIALRLREKAPRDMEEEAEARRIMVLKDMRMGITIGISSTMSYSCKVNVDSPRVLVNMLADGVLLQKGDAASVAV